MLTFDCARTLRASRPATLTGTALALALITTATPIQAQDVRVGGCVGTWGAVNCVTRWAPGGDPYIRPVPQPRDATERARAEAADHRWLDRCHPHISQDSYGVVRYHYTKPGCEFGVGEY